MWRTLSVGPPQPEATARGERGDPQERAESIRVWLIDQPGYNLNLDFVLEQNVWTPGIDQPPGVRAQRGEQVVVGPDGVLGLSAAGLITLVVVKIAISIPVSGVERFERIAAHHGMNRSPFFQRAGRKLADELVGESELAALANAALARAGQPSDDGSTLAESQRIITQRSPW